MGFWVYIGGGGFEGYGSLRLFYFGVDVNDKVRRRILGDGGIWKGKS